MTLYTPLPTRRGPALST